MAGTAADEHSRAAEPRGRIADEIGDVGIALRYPVDASRGRAERPKD